MTRAAAIACASVALLAGCGDDGGADQSRDYERAVDAVGRKVTASASYKGVQSFGADLPPGTTPEQIAVGFSQFQDVLRQFATGLAGVTPPAEVAAAHRKWISGIQLSADDLQGAVDLLRAHDPATIAAVRRGQPTDVTRPDHAHLIAEARAELSAKGYDFEGAALAPGAPGAAP